MFSNEYLRDRDNRYVGRVTTNSATHERTGRLADGRILGRQDRTGAVRDQNGRIEYQRGNVTTLFGRR